MNFKIFHSITYSYSEKVFIEPMVLRLRPRTDAFQRLIDFHLEIDPKPEGVSEGNDLEGCPAHYLHFSGTYDHLKIEARSSVQTLKQNPFDYILTAVECNALPIRYPAPLAEELQPYLSRPVFSTGLQAFVDDILNDTGKDTLNFLSRLNGLIHDTFEAVKRETGHPLSSEEVFQSREGACRDLTFLFMEICRSVGLAARYVSGYTFADADLVEGELHAWAEVYLPGGGWRGYDPTLGLAVADRHIVLTTNRNSHWTLPLSGTFRSGGATAAMTYQVRVKPY